MHCRNCGSDVHEQAVMCVKCGVPPADGSKFCQTCGEETNPNADVCVKCGVKLASISGGGEGKDWMTTLILSILGGWLGIHRFYTGHTWIGIVQLLTFGGCGIWVLIDIMSIATGRYKNADGNVLVKK